VIAYLAESLLVGCPDEREWDIGGLEKPQRFAGLISVLICCSGEMGVVCDLSWEPDIIGTKGHRRPKVSKEVW